MRGLRRSGAIRLTPEQAQARSSGINDSGWQKSILWLTGQATKCGNTFTSARFPTIRCMTNTIPVSGAPTAHARSPHKKTHGLDDGQARAKRSAACTNAIDRPDSLTGCSQRIVVEGRVARRVLLFFRYRATRPQVGVGTSAFQAMCFLTMRKMGTASNCAATAKITTAGIEMS